MEPKLSANFMVLVEDLFQDILFLSNQYSADIEIFQFSQNKQMTMQAIFKKDAIEFEGEHLLGQT